MQQFILADLWCVLFSRDGIWTCTISCMGYEYENFSRWVVNLNIFLRWDMNRILSRDGTWIIMIISRERIWNKKHAYNVFPWWDMNTCIIFTRDKKYEFSYFFVQTHFPAMGYVLLFIPKIGKRYSVEICCMSNI